MSILIVDDTPDNIFLLKEILEKKGFSECTTATSAQEAFQKIGLGIDLVLMDIMMPEINGIDACRILKSMETARDIPVIMVTAKTELESVEQAFEAGALDYIVKPVKKIDLLARVRSALALKKAMDQRKERERELETRNHELEKAFQEIKTLRGFLPICAHCKKIRNLEGCWEQIEAYIQVHADVKFSHGICETCMHEKYPDYAGKKEGSGHLRGPLK